MKCAGRAFAAIILFWSFLSASAQAETAPQHLTLQATMRPMNKQAIPYSGVLKLQITSEGVVSGTYVSNSVGPDPLKGRVINVSGGLNGSNIHLTFGPGANARVNGTFKHGQIVGTGYFRGGMYDFSAAAR